MILIRGLVAIKWAARLKRAPESSKVRNRFKVRWMVRNEIRKSPVILMKNFRPMEALMKLLIKIWY
jgi:hypothetical protein